jgi:hypothetical protein
MMTQFNKHHILREKNAKADALSQYASSKVETHSGSIYFQVSRTPTVNSRHVAHIVIGGC